jgi:hypothetical protein
MRRNPSWTTTMTRKSKETRYESYEVYDDHGNAVGRVVLPRQRRFLGAERGTVYLNRQPTLRRGALRSRNPQAA